MVEKKKEDELVSFALSDNGIPLNISKAVKAEAIFKEENSDRFYLEPAVIIDGSHGIVATKMPLVKLGESWVFKFKIEMPKWTHYSNIIKAITPEEVEKDDGIRKISDIRKVGNNGKGIRKTNNRKNRPGRR